MRRRRVVIMVGVCALLGVATTVVSSWAIQCAYMRVPGGMTSGMLIEGEHAWTVTSWLAPGRRSYTLRPVHPELIALGNPASRHPDAVPLQSIMANRAEVPSWVPREGREGGVMQLAVGAYGWPMVSLRGELRIYASMTDPANTNRGAWQVVPRAWHGRPYPTGLSLIPVWPGFAVNMVFFAAVWGAVLIGVPAAVRARRWGEGRCPGCGYDLRGQVVAGCPECGEGRGGGDGEVSRWGGEEVSNGGERIHHRGTETQR